MHQDSQSLPYNEGHNTRYGMKIIFHYLSILLQAGRNTDLMPSLTLQPYIELLLLKLEHFDLSKKQSFAHIAIEIEAIDISMCFKTQAELPKIYWRNRQNSEESTCLGCTLELKGEKQLQQFCTTVLPKQPELRLFGGRAFDISAEPWPNFANTQFILPMIELRREQQSYKLICNLKAGQDHWQSSIAQAKQQLLKLQQAKPSQTVHLQIQSRHEQPAYDLWQQLVTEVTSTEFQSHTAKVVLSRETVLNCNAVINNMDLLLLWRQYNPNCFQFIFQFTPEHSFIGCSPERLYQRQNKHLLTEALAGTVSRGLNPEEDQQLANELLKDEKSLHENQLVLDDIRKRLKKISHQHQVEPQTNILKLNKIQHLKRNVQADIKPQINDCDLLAHLHPTPAVGGSPRAKALDYIKHNEVHHRGWYAGAVGYLSQDCSEFAVAIRCALLQGKQIKLYAGAGIVTGSNPKQEWDELEHKISTLLSILNNELKR